MVQQSLPVPDGQLRAGIAHTQGCASHMNVTAILQRAIQEDLGAGDVTTAATIPNVAATGRGVFVAKESGVLAGIEPATQVFKIVGAEAVATWTHTDGEWIETGAVLGEVTGRIHTLLAAERVALNVLQRMSGIATETHRMVEEVKPLRAAIRDTRKTAPGLRQLDKWAVSIGGGVNHRMGLYDRMLIKDNHVTAAGGIKAALKAAGRYAINMNTPCAIDIEARTLEEVAEVLEVGGFEVLLLDNMARTMPDGSLDSTMLNTAVSMVNGKYLTEASGNVTLRTVRQIAASGVNFIACGCLTHSVKALDISLSLVAD